MGLNLLPMALNIIPPDMASGMGAPKSNLTLRVLSPAPLCGTAISRPNSDKPLSYNLP